MKKETEKIMLKNSIRLIIGGWLYDGGDIMEVPNIFDEIYNDYNNEIEKQKVELSKKLAPREE